MRRLIVVLLPLVGFASFETTLAVLTATVVPTATSAGGPLQQAPQGPLSLLWVYSPHLSIIAWGAVVAITLYGRAGRGIFARKGFEGDVYELMVKMRGSGSRLSLLHALEEPKHRLELAKVTGMDWKEVDRQLKVLENYGLVRVSAQSGAIKLYQITEQGRILLKLINDLSREGSSPHTPINP